MDFPTVTVTGTGLIGVIEWQGYAEYNQAGAPGWPAFAPFYFNPSYISSPADSGGRTYTFNPGIFPSTFWDDADVAPGRVYTELDPSVYPASATATQENYNLVGAPPYSCADISCTVSPDCCIDGVNQYDSLYSYGVANGYNIYSPTDASDWPVGSFLYDSFNGAPNGPWLEITTPNYDATYNVGGEITLGIQPNYSIFNIDYMPPDTVYTVNVANDISTPFGVQAYDHDSFAKYSSDTYNPSGLECSFKVYRGTIEQFTLNDDGTISTTAALLSTQSFTYTSSDIYNNNFSVQRAAVPVPVGGPFGEFGVPSGGGGNPPATQNNPGPPIAEAIFFIRQGTLNWHRGLTYGQKAWYTGLNKGQGAGFSWVGSFPWFLPPGVREPTV